MTRKKKIWVGAFLGVTAAALGAELYASFDGSGNTTPWTDLIVTYIPEEITIAAIGALMIWLPYHFVVRYRRKGKEEKE